MDTKLDNEHRHKLHLVLDIDGTLVSEIDKATSDKLGDTVSESILDEIVLPRPHLKHFLQTCFEHCHKVSIWTAASPEWFNYIYRKHLKPITEELKVEFDKVYTDGHCTQIYDMTYNTTVTIKKLKKLWKRSDSTYTKHNTLIIDDSPYTYMKNHGNAMGIKKYKFHHTNDAELLRLSKYLVDIKKYIEKAQSIRVVDKNY
jgi:hypothetical protein